VLPTIRHLAARVAARPGLAKVVTIMLGACCLSLIYGTDNNWDLRNYHLYNPFAWLEGRLPIDLFAAGPQSYFNPMLDVPYYLLSVRLIPHWPRLVAFLAGIPFGLLTLVVVRIASIMLPGPVWLVVGATVLGVTGTATLSEIGTTYGDIPMAVLILGGLIPPLALLRKNRPATAQWMVRAMVAGFFFGVAAGLKPVACIFAPGAALGLACAGGTRRFVLTGLVFTVAWVAGFALAFGPWGFVVDRQFGSPVFPLLNQIFASPWVPPVGGADTRFLPQELWQTLFYPFFWLRGQAFVVAEFGVRDPRFALSYLALAVILWHAIRCRRIDAPALAVCVFFVVSFIAWEAMFSILRYALPLEAVTGILLIRATLILYGERSRDGRWLLAVAGVAVIAVFAVSSRPGWGRLRGFGTAVFEVQAPKLPDHAAVVFVNRPSAFIAPFLKGNDLLFAGIEGVPLPSRLAEEITRRIQGRPTIMAVLRGAPADFGGLTSAFGLRILSQTCAPILSVNQRDLQICECARLAPPG
jgi:hypothetical protein